MREGLSRFSPVLVLLAFGFPLFIGLGQADLANDEAIYSFAVESVLRTGDWLSPRSSPNLHIVFLEKPPLKFWIVAAPIRLGLLPLDEFGLRFWDAAFGALAFMYVFLLGRRLAGPVCGVAAVLVLVAHDPLIFDHGLRSNNMEAALVLAYCAGVHHYLRWAESSDRRRRFGHAAAVGAAFFLGFMTKFVAALFLPMVLAASALLIASHRARFIEDFRRWLAIAGVLVALVLPWFVFQYAEHGQVLIKVMFGEHVYTRFTSFADPHHLEPWHFYISTAYKELATSGAVVWVGLGLVILLIDAVRKPLPDAWVVILWLVLPIPLISLGSSKLYHYFYPYVPPLALAAGYGIAWLVRLCMRLDERALARLGRAPVRPPHVARAIALIVVAAGVGLAIATAVEGTVRITWGDRLLFRNTSVERPLITAALASIAAVRLPAISGVAAALVAWLFLPTPVGGYLDNLAKLRDGTHPIRSMASCVRQINADRQKAGLEVPGVYAPVSEAAYLHPYFYYLGGSGWHARGADHATIDDALRIPGRERPVILDRTRYAEYLEASGGRAPYAVSVDWPNVILLLPGPYGECRDTQPLPPR